MQLKTLIPKQLYGKSVIAKNRLNKTIKRELLTYTIIVKYLGKHEALY